MRPRAFALALVAVLVAVACFDISGSSLGSLFLRPILDSLFVGDSGGPDSVILLDPSGQSVNPGAITWSITPASVATIDPTTGVFHAAAKGQALITATAKAAGNAAQALLVVSRPLDLTLLMDTVFLMPGDTYHVPLAVVRKPQTVPADTVRFTPLTNGPYTIDTAGSVTAIAPGGGPYVARVRSGTDSVVDTGGVVVMMPSSLSGGRFFVTAVGANTRHEGGAALAEQYANSAVSGALVFLLTDTLGSSSDTIYERLLLARPESISTAPVAYAIDSVDPQEAGVVRPPNNIVCNPPRVWAIWQAINPLRKAATAYSHPLTLGAFSGLFSVTRRVPVGAGYVISGRYAFTAQRGDLYFDRNGLVTFTGTFVAPLVATSCPAAP